MKLPKVDVNHIGAYAGIISAAIALWVWHKSASANQGQEASNDLGLQYYLPAGASTSGYQGGGGSDLSGLLSSSLSALTSDTGGDSSSATYAIQQQSDLASQSLGASLLAGFLPSGSSGASQFSITTGDGQTLSAQANVLNVGQSNDILSNAGVAALLNQAVPTANVKPQKSVTPVTTSPLKVSAAPPVQVKTSTPAPAPKPSSSSSSSSLSASDQAMLNYDLKKYNDQLKAQLATPSQVWGNGLYPAYPGF
jgi:hypothetical protein